MKKRVKKSFLLDLLGISLVVLLFSISYYYVQSGLVARETAKTLEFGLFR